MANESALRMAAEHAGRVNSLGARLTPDSAPPAGYWDTPTFGDMGQAG